MTEIDVFISHATADDAMVTKIHDTLEAVGLNVWVDHEDGINVGDNFSKEIDDAVKACNAGLFVMSPTSIKSDYCTAEWQPILGSRKILYIAMIAPVPPDDIPVRLGVIQYVDLSANFDVGMAQLVKAMQSKRLLTAEESAAQQTIKISGSTFPRSYLDLPLIGRDDALATVNDLLADNAARAVSILGFGGLGKTRLAAEIATQAAFRDGVIWHTIAPYTNVDRLTGLIRDHLRLENTTPDDATWAQLAHRQCLIVLDNAEDATNPASYAARVNALDTSGGARVLLTSRLQWREIRGKTFDLPALNPDDARAVFDAMLARENPAFAPTDDDEKRTIAVAAHLHPRLLEYCVGWLHGLPRRLCAGDASDPRRGGCGRIAR